MADFIARIALTQQFSKDHEGDLGSFAAKVTEHFPEEAQAVLEIGRFTFACYLLKAETKAECRNFLEQAWEKAFPGEPFAEIQISEIGDVETDGKSKYIKGIYTNFYGMDDFVRRITELLERLPYLRELGAEDVIKKQNYLCAIDAGCGFSTLISGLSTVLIANEVFPKPEDGTDYAYGEFVMGAEEKNGCFDEDSAIDLLRDEENKKSLHVIGIDISYFLEGNKTDELRRFVRRIEDLQRDYVFVFRIPFLEKKAFDEIKTVLSDMMLLETIQIPPYSDLCLMEYLWENLNKAKLMPDVAINEIAIEKIHQEKMDGRFYGYKSVEKIANEIILHKIADNARKKAEGAEVDPFTLNPEDISGLVQEEKGRATGYAALAELIGMEDITVRIREIIAQIKVAMANEKLDRPSIHMRFTGAPGTGKTTVARIIGQIMREEGILRKGAFFEYSGRDLVAEYVGQTAVKTSTICRDSYGSVLFIDEAYSLYTEDHSTNDFGKEAITTLISEMENHRDDMLVVMAGYTDEMETLMKANPGIRSRMPVILHFPNYSKKQLFDIFMLMVRKHFAFDPGLEEESHKYFMALSDKYLESKEFANARFVRNLYERTWSKAALRCSLAGVSNIVLTREDFIAASGEKEFNEKIEVQKVVGFK